MPQVDELSVEQVSRAIGRNVDLWPGHCYAIASAMLEAGVVAGRCEYGFYYGPISDRSIFSRRAAASGVRHGWIRLPDNTICDPTRWVFEAVEPYIYFGDDQQSYDMGMNRLRASLMSQPPGKDAHLTVFELVISDDGARKFIVDLFEVVGVSGKKVKLNLAQMAYLANFPYHLLGENARPIYETLIRSRLGSWIPIDNKAAAGLQRATT